MDSFFHNATTIMRLTVKPSRVINTMRIIRWAVVSMMLIVGLSVGIDANTYAASFDCRKARSFSEHAVCNDAKLSALDDTLSTVYAHAYAAAKDPNAVAATRNEEWHWRQTKCRDTACVSNWYARRIAELQADGNSQLADNAGALPVKRHETVALLPALAAASPLKANFQRQGIHSIAHAQAGNGKSLPVSGESGPLPPDGTSGIVDVAAVDIAMSAKPFEEETGTRASLTAPGWPALPPVSGESLRDGDKFREFKNLDRTAARTIGVYVGY